MESKNDQKITELGVDILNFTDDKPKTKTRCYRGKLKIFREFTLATLSTLTKMKQRDKLEGNTTQRSALDAFSGTGIAGLQWKKYLGKNVHVTLVEHNDMSLLYGNAASNGISCREFELKPAQVPGVPFSLQDEKEVHVSQAEARAVLAIEAFNFIFLSPHKSCAAYFDSALQNLKGEGILCLVMPDVSVFVRSPHVVKRSYDADVVKTEYFKEMAARIILACLARASARFSKGISSQYVLSHEDNLLLCIKVTRGHAAADMSLRQVASLLHCRFCEERTFMPNQLAPVENPYSLLACKCKQTNPGKTAVILGPMWNGSLNDIQFLESIHREGKQLHLSSKYLQTVQSLVMETKCSDSERTSQTGIYAEHQIIPGASEDQNDNTHIVTNTSDMPPTAPSDSSNGATDSPPFLNMQEDIMESHGENIQTVSPGTECSLTVMEGLGTASKVREAPINEKDKTDLMGISSQKRKADASSESEIDNISASKCRRVNDTGCSSGLTCVPFYYGVNKFKRTHIPRLDKLVTILQSHGHRASRTHFDPCAIRTSATVAQFLGILG